MNNRFSTLRYVIQNFHTGGDPALEQTRQEAIKEYEALMLQASRQADRRKQPRGSAAYVEDLRTTVLPLMRVCLPSPMRFVQ